MTSKGQISRDRIVEAANRLIYTKGYHQTSVADVANEVGITKGNLHYHFKTKDEILYAIVEKRMENISLNLASWEQEYSNPIDRLKRFVQMLLSEEKDIIRYGCPMGTLNLELGKCQLSLRDKSREMFDLFLHWLEKAFKELGKKNSKTLSKHLLAMAQGATVVSFTYHNSRIIKDECKLINEWIDSLV